MKDEIFKKLKREILKSAKKGYFHYYWDITGLNKILVNIICEELEKDNKMIKSKGNNFKIIMW